MYNQSFVSSKTYDLAAIHSTTQFAKDIAHSKVVIHITLKEDEFEYVQRLVHPAPLYSRHSTCGGGHPIAAALLEISNQRANNYRGEGTIEIGPSITVKGVNTNSHNCWAFGDARDNARHQNNLVKLRKYDTTRDPWAPKFWQDMCDALQNPNQCNGPICYSGIQQCNGKGHQIISIHSAYDIPHEDWPEIFERTGARKASIWMYLPTELLDQRVKDTRFYNYGEDEENSYFWFPGDTSYGYIHNTNNWRRYLTCTHEVGRIGIAIFEIVNWLGPVAQIQVNYVPGACKIVRTLIPLHKDVVAVPDVTDWVATGTRNKARDILVDRHHAESVLAYAERLPGHSFEQRTVLSFAVGRTFSLRIGGITRVQSWQIKHRILSEVVARICQIAIIRRDEQNQTMSYVARCLQNRRFERTMGDFFYKWIGKIANWTMCGAFFTFLFRRTFRTGLFAAICAAVRYFVRKRFEECVPKRACNCDENDPYTAQLFDLEEVAITGDVRRVNCLEGTDEHALDVVRSIHLAPPISKECEEHDGGGDEGTEETNVESQRSVYPPRKNLHDPGVLDRFTDLLVDHIRACSQSHLALAKSNAQLLLDCTSKCPRDTSSVVLSAYIGGPGTGKSTQLKSRPDWKDMVVVSPMRALANDYISKGFTAYTVDVAVQNALHAKIVVLDECFLMHAGHFAAYLLYGECDEIVLLGDESQINFIDFEGHYEEKVNTSVALPFSTIHYLHDTYRCPKDVTRLLNANFGYRMVSKSEVTKSIVLGSPDERVNRTLVFTQAAKLAYQGSETVHAVQGQTFEVVHLIVTNDSISLLNNSKNHFVVGISRHTRRIFLDYKIDAEDRSRLECCVNLSQAYVDTLQNEAQVIITPIPAVEEEVVKPVPHEEEVIPMAKVWCPESIDNILRTMIAGYDASERIHPSALRMPGTNLVLREPHLSVPGTIEYRMKGLMFDHTTRSSDQMMTLKTLIDRYSTATSQLEGGKAKIAAMRLYGAFMDTYIGKIVPITGEVLDAAYLNNILVQVSKQTATQVNYPANDQFVGIANFFMKEQSKVKLSACDETEWTGDIRGKAGQGVSAWSKTMNAICGGMVRALNKALQESLREDVFFVGGMNEAVNLMAISNIKAPYFTLETDLSEFDSMQNRVTVEFERLLMERLGAPEWFLNLYTTMRMHWRLKARGLAHIDVTGKKASGEPATLFNNTNTCAAIIALAYNVKDALIFVKGDDFAAVSNEPMIARYEDLKEVIANCPNLDIKQQYGEALQFVSFFLTPNGAVPDLVRLAAKIKSKPLKVTAQQIKRTKWLKVSNVVANNHPTTIHDQPNTVDVLNKVDMIVPENLARFLFSSDKKVVHLNLHTVPQNHVYFNYFARLADKVLVLHMVENGLYNAVRAFKQSVVSRLAMMDTRTKQEAAIQYAAAHYHLQPAAVLMLYEWCSTFANASLVHAAKYYTKELVHSQPAQVDSTFEAKPDKGVTTIMYLDCGSNGWDCYYRCADYIGVPGEVSATILDKHGVGKWVDAFDVATVFHQYGLGFVIYIGNAAHSNVALIHGEQTYKLFLHNAHWHAVVPSGGMVYREVMLARAFESIIEE